WNAYARAHGHSDRASGVRVLTDLISLVRCVVQLEDELVPYPELVQRRYCEWLLTQELEGLVFTPEQRKWMDRITYQIGLNLGFSMQDLNDYFYAEGGLLAVRRLFGDIFPQLLGQL
ncbi:MAG: hypothetical protein JXA42_03475, partial [Anaerolineales bacterium]|nr:hypothetical protein [Anaerolineales bacterium]